MSATLADAIAPELPYLRRFARALTGSQSRGDAYVVALLEALVAEPSAFGTDISPRASLYRAFTKVWGSVSLNLQKEPVDADPQGLVDKRIESLTPLPRQAFLLSAVEEFSISDIAAILSQTELQVRRLIDEAGREIADQIAARVMIIEDEPLIALDIETLVTEIGHEVVGIARTREEAVVLAGRKHPGLVLADIQLADGSSGIDAVNDILASAEVPVIFITAYPERLLTGARAEPAFLITKPFKPEMVKAVISQALFFDIKSGRRSELVVS
ncbi:MAG: response regulator [Hyphomicrobiaceae bacterium]|nr:response regulator [Hyphomicrobiaceae bacterium]